MLAVVLLFALLTVGVFGYDDVADCVADVGGTVQYVVVCGGVAVIYVACYYVDGVDNVGVYGVVRDMRDIIYCVVVFMALLLLLMVLMLVWLSLVLVSLLLLSLVLLGMTSAPVCWCSLSVVLRVFHMYVCCYGLCGLV